MADIDDIIHDIRAALTEAQRVEMDQRLAAAADKQARVGVLMRMRLAVYRLNRSIPPDMPARQI